MPTHPSHHDTVDDPDGTTRTRLPETTPGTPSRRPARPSRTLVTVVGVVVLLLAALAFATRGPDASPTPDTDKAPHPTPTTPTGQSPVTTATSGIPTGFPKTAQGAQSAAANYAVALGGEGMFTAQRRHEIIDAVYDPAVTGTLRPDLDKVYSGAYLTSVGLRPDGSAPSGMVFVSRTVPVGTKTTAFGGGSATVEVWCTGLVGLAGSGSTKPVTDTWLTVTEHLKWIGNDWKIESSSQRQGPAPISGDIPVAGANEIADAVNGYGGFTYAR